MDIEEFLYNEAIASVGLDVSAHLWDSKDAIRTYQNSLEAVMRRLKTRQGEDWVKLHNVKDMRMFMRLVYQEASVVKKKPTVPKKTPVAVIRGVKKGGKVKAVGSGISSGTGALSEQGQVPIGHYSYGSQMGGGGTGASAPGAEQGVADIEVFDVDADVRVDGAGPRKSSSAQELAGVSTSGSSRFFESLLFDEAEETRGANTGAPASGYSNNFSANTTSSSSGRLGAMHKNISTTTFANEVMADGTPIYMPSSISTYDLSAYRGTSPDGMAGEGGSSSSPMYGSGDEYMYGGSLSPPPPLMSGHGGASMMMSGGTSTSPPTVPPDQALSAEDIRRQRLEEQREREKRELQAMKHVDLDKNRRIMMDAWDEF
jgi:hypothetical protein